MNVEKNKPQKPKGCAFLVVFVVMLVFIVIKCVGGDSSDDLKNEKHDKIEALVLSQECVKDNLKCPSTAEFASGTKNVTQINDTTFDVSSYVDSQNSFGAMIRTYYSCTITFNSQGKYFCTNLITQ